MSDHEIRAAVAAGACDAEGLAASCNAGTRCGGCRPVVDAILSETTVTIATAA
ncbi:MAG: (2Fe-2S)-binding protein [Acidimicrobiales bacterium]|nr:(2Fe-2S)-binding protein [Acidimicrobiales bacterium]